ncbi:hypothetical protein [Brucella thiophenivorans]|uniref:hypothetical protein n=1 Tax=Brucella thiophenivorans TaxID=571255 RepID=UPI000B9941F9|nr:hypothetical protein [Brucella thiophenivorans]
MSTITRFALIVLAGSFFIYPATAAVDCTGVDQALTKERKTEYAKLISESLKEKVKPAKVEVDSFMQSGDWTVVYASTPVADPGYFFFDNSSGKQTFKDVWGGMADDGDGPKLVKFAEDLGANQKIAVCFSKVVMSD